MKKHISILSLLLALVFLLTSCQFINDMFDKEDQEQNNQTNPKGYLDSAIALASEKISISYTDAKDEGYLAFLQKLDSFVAKFSAAAYEKYGDGDILLYGDLLNKALK